MSMHVKINATTVAIAIILLLLMLLLANNGCNNMAIGCNEKRSEKYEKDAATGERQIQQLDSARQVIIRKIEIQQALDSQANYYEDLIKRSQQITANRKKDEVVAARDREVYVKKNKDTHETIKRAAKINDNKQLLLTIDSIRARLRHMPQE